MTMRALKGAPNALVARAEEVHAPCRVCTDRFTRRVPDAPAYVVSADGGVHHAPVGVGVGRPVRRDPIDGGWTVRLSQPGAKGGARRMTVQSVVASAWHGPRPPGMVAVRVGHTGPDDYRPCTIAWGTRADAARAWRVRQAAIRDGRIPT